MRTDRLSPALLDLDSGTTANYFRAGNMKPSRRTWLFLCSALAIPPVSALLAASWLLPRLSESENVVSISYGFVPWLVVERQTASSSIVPWGVLTCGAVAMGLIAAMLFCVRALVNLGNVQDRCHRCGYRLIVETVQCPECGQDRFDRRTVLAPFYRPLIGGALLLFALPGLFLWVILGLAWQLVTTMSAPRGGIFLVQTLGVLIMVSMLVGMLWVARYKRALSLGE